MSRNHLASLTAVLIMAMIGVASAKPALAPELDQRDRRRLLKSAEVWETPVALGQS